MEEFTPYSSAIIISGAKSDWGGGKITCLGSEYVVFVLECRSLQIYLCGKLFTNFIVMVRIPIEKKPLKPNCNAFNTSAIA